MSEKRRSTGPARSRKWMGPALSLTLICVATTIWPVAAVEAASAPLCQPTEIAHGRFEDPDSVVSTNPPWRQAAPVLGANIAWPPTVPEVPPGDDDRDQAVPFDTDWEWEYQPLEDNTCWHHGCPRDIRFTDGWDETSRPLKEALAEDINELFRLHWMDRPNRTRGFTLRVHIPAYMIEPERSQAIVQRFLELAENRDGLFPSEFQVAFLIKGSVWWSHSQKHCTGTNDLHGCDLLWAPEYWNAESGNLAANRIALRAYARSQAHVLAAYGITTRNILPEGWDERPIRRDDAYRLVEWWGWNDGYIWARWPGTTLVDNETECLEEVGSGRYYQGRCNVLYRNWGSRFPIFIPHPHYAHPAFRLLTYRAIRPIAEALATESARLAADGKSHLLAYVVADNEVAYGRSWSPEAWRTSSGSLQVSSNSLFGTRAWLDHGRLATNSHRTRNCDSEDSDETCIEEAAGSAFDEAGNTTDLSRAYWRPDNFLSVQRQGVQDYLGFVAGLFYDAGLPRYKIVSHSLLYTRLRSSTRGEQGHSTVQEGLRFSDAALNSHSIPGFSFYGDEIRYNYDRTRRYLEELVTNRGREEYAMVEYQDYVERDEARRDLYRFLSNENLPVPLYVNYVALNQVLWDRQGNLKSDPRWYSARSMIREWFQNHAGSVCDNGVIEHGEDCDSCRFPEGETGSCHGCRLE